MKNNEKAHGRLKDMPEFKSLNRVVILSQKRADKVKEEQLVRELEAKKKSYDYDYGPGW